MLFSSESIVMKYSEYIPKISEKITVILNKPTYSSDKDPDTKSKNKIKQSQGEQNVRIIENKMVPEQPVTVSPLKKQSEPESV